MNQNSRNSPSKLTNKEIGMARALGWFSIGLGLAEILLPRELGRAIGVKANKNLMRFLGLREILSGVGILTQKSSSGWMWSRVGGDAMDLALLGTAMTASNNRIKTAAATAAVAGVTALDYMSSRRLTSAKQNGDGQINKMEITQSITIDRSAADLYSYWHNFENLPNIMPFIKSVTHTGPNKLRWVSQAPAGSVEWEAEITQDVPNKLIGWRSLPGSTVETSGVISFDPATGGRGTVVRIEMRYNPPLGLLGATAAKLFGQDAIQQAHDVLRFFKQIMETGVISTTRGQPAGRKSGTSKKFDHATPKLEQAEAARAALPAGSAEYAH